MRIPTPFQIFDDVAEDVRLVASRPHLQFADLVATVLILALFAAFVAPVVMRTRPARESAVPAQQAAGQQPVHAHEGRTE